jgi:hypothetical protein
VPTLTNDLAPFESIPLRTALFQSGWRGLHHGLLQLPPISYPNLCTKPHLMAFPPSLTILILPDPLRPGFPGCF